jgi:hypothetical protein
MWIWNRVLSYSFQGQIFNSKCNAIFPVLLSDSKVWGLISCIGRVPNRQNRSNEVLKILQGRLGRAFASTPRSAPPESIRGAALWGTTLYRYPGPPCPVFGEVQAVVFHAGVLC